MAAAPPNSNPVPEPLTLPALQDHVCAQCQLLGWDRAETEQTFLLFIEEVGELAKAIRRKRKLMIEGDNPAKPVLDSAQIDASLAEEFADVLGYVVHLANDLGVDLAAAYRAGSDDDQRRSWR